MCIRDMVTSAQVKHQRREADDEQHARAEPQEQRRSLQRWSIADEVAIAADHELHDLGVTPAVLDQRPYLAAQVVGEFGVRPGE